MAAALGSSPTCSATSTVQPSAAAGRRLSQAGGSVTLQTTILIEVLEGLPFETITEEKVKEVGRWPGLAWPLVL